VQGAPLMIVGTTAGSSTALFTDHYELTMLDAAVASGVAEHRALFEVFTRHLPAGRAYGVVGGIGRLLTAIEQFRFGEAELAYLERRDFLAPATLDWLADCRFEGRIDGYREGELYFPSSPVLTVESTFGQGVLLETLVLSVLNYDSAVAGAAVRMVSAARGHPLIEMGGRRVHEEAAVAAARVACLTGFSSTSNLEAGRRWGLPTAGTSAHAFTLAYPDERSAFAAQMQRLGVQTTLLVDTYDTLAGLRSAVEVARSLGAPGPGAVRLDSGDPAEEARRARRELDALGATGTRIVVSGDLDEYVIDRLETGPGGRAPIDGYGVGTRLVTGSGAPTAEMVYKLVAVADTPGVAAPLRSVSKRSAAKVTLGGRKRAWRLLDQDGRARAERVVIEEDDSGGGSGRDGGPVGGSWGGGGGSVGGDGDRGNGDGRRGSGSDRALQVRLIVAGEVVHRPSNDEIAAHHRVAKSELGPDALSLHAERPALEAHPISHVDGG
jgi:nicotinate phosphoribosyltransferase